MLKKIFIGLGAILAIGVIWVAVYLNTYYKPDDVATKVYEESVKTEDYYYYESKSRNNSVGVIIYPGGKVDEKAYSTLAKEINTKNDLFTIVLKVPVRLAILDPDKAKVVMNDFPDIKEWIIVGHSLGGSSASMYLEKDTDKVKGLVFVGSYSLSDLSKTNLKVISLLGTNDMVVRKEVFEKNKINLPKDTEYINIEGGNHAWFGNYGKQKGDGEATITNQEQQIKAAEAVGKIVGIK